MSVFTGSVHRMVPGLLGILKSRSALAELGRTTGGLEAVLKQYYSFSPVFTRPSEVRLPVFPYELTHH